MKKFLYTSLVMLVLLFGLSLLTDCRQSVDPNLHCADMLMDERPDSALSILESHEISDNIGDYDRALYGLLLTQARYKNFIDETNDSLISASADYFLIHDDKDMASRALFHAGMIQINANRLGDAAVSFTKGIDMARDIKSYMWEGRCAQGLFMIYCKLMNSSEQIKYAEEAYDAYFKGGFDSWADYARLDLASAYNKNGQNEKSMAIIKDIEESAREKKDTLVLSETLQLRGFSLLCKDSINQFTEIGHVVKEREDVFFIMARERKYKNAYESRERYNNSQDSVLSLIIKNNVSESVNQYKRMSSFLRDESIRKIRRGYSVVILMVLIICIKGFLRYREYVHKKESMRHKAHLEFESLGSDLSAQYEKTRIYMVEPSEKQGQTAKEDFASIIRQQYAEINSLCDEYYQSSFSRKDNENVADEINGIVRGLTEKEGIEKVIDYVDKQSNGLYSSFKNDFFDMSEENLRLFLYLLLGFSARTISVILGLDLSVVYNRKSRLRAKVSKSSVARKDDYLRLF